MAERNYMVKVTHMNGGRCANGQVRVAFRGNLKQLLHAERVQIKSKDWLLCFVPDDGGRTWYSFNADTDTVNVQSAEAVKMLMPYIGTYDKIHKHENGFLYVDVREKRETAAQVNAPERKEPVASPYNNPYKEQPKGAAALRAIVKEYRDKADKLVNDILEAEKMVEELKREFNEANDAAECAEKLLSLIEKKEA